MLLLEHSVEYTELGDGLHYILRISVSFLLLLNQLLYSVFLFEKKKKRNQIGRYSRQNFIMQFKTN